MKNLIDSGRGVSKQHFSVRGSASPDHFSCGTPVVFIEERAGSVLTGEIQMLSVTRLSSSHLLSLGMATGRAIIRGRNSLP